MKYEFKCKGEFNPQKFKFEMMSIIYSRFSLIKNNHRIYRYMLI